MSRRPKTSGFRFGDEGQSDVIIGKPLSREEYLEGLNRDRDERAMNGRHRMNSSGPSHPSPPSQARSPSAQPPPLSHSTVGPSAPSSPKLKPRHTPRPRTAAATHSPNRGDEGGTTVEDRGGGGRTEVLVLERAGRAGPDPLRQSKSTMGFPGKRDTPRSRYHRELDEQVREKSARKAAERQREAEDARRLRSLSPPPIPLSPVLGGGGAPLRSGVTGAIITNTRGSFHNEERMLQSQTIDLARASPVQGGSRSDSSMSVETQDSFEQQQRRLAEQYASQEETWTNVDTHKPHQRKVVERAAPPETSPGLRTPESQHLPKAPAASPNTPQGGNSRGSRPRTAAGDRSEYLQELEVQISEDRKRKEQARLEELEWERRKEEEMAIYQPFGRGGGGTPLKDEHGNVVTNTRGILSGKDDTKIQHEYLNKKLLTPTHGHLEREGSSGLLRVELSGGSAVDSGESQPRAAKIARQPSVGMVGPDTEEAPSDGSAGRRDDDDKLRIISELYQENAALKRQLRAARQATVTEVKVGEMRCPHQGCRKLIQVRVIAGDVDKATGMVERWQMDGFTLDDQEG